MKSRDYKFLKDLLSGFFSKKHIQGALIDFCRNEILDFEPWLQVELARYMSNLDTPHEWWREQYMSFDKRKTKNIDQNGMYIDFQIRPYNHKIDWYILLEIKQNFSVQSCITLMNKDIYKVSLAKSSSVNSRSFWVLGVHSRESKTVIKDIVQQTAEQRGVEVERNNIFTKMILNTEYCFTLFRSEK